MRRHWQFALDGSAEFNVAIRTLTIEGKNRVSPNRISSSDVLRHHKTDWRSLYDEERAAANKDGCDEVIYLNERDDVAEGSATNIFVRVGTRLLTPPLESGALDGCLRRALLDNGECFETVLRVADLERGSVFLGNSVRGLIGAVRFAG